MQPLPIVDRELRVASRQARTWWRRGLIFMATLAVFGFIWLETSAWAGANAIGRNLFGALTFLGLTYATLAGPLTTVDCLARERREGTLGLLFLTDLKSYDVVLGKAFAATLDLLLGFLVVLPLAALPILLGGVSLRDYAWVVVSVFDLMFFSLALGTLASSCFASMRAALGSTLIVLGFAIFGILLIGEAVFGLRFGSPQAAWFYAFSPASTFYECLEGVSRGSSGRLVLNLCVLHGLGWLFLLLAILRTRTSWRQAPGSGWGERLRNRLATWTVAHWRGRTERRETLLRRFPVDWLESRDRMQGLLLWTVFGVSTLFWLYRHFSPWGQPWPDSEHLIFWALFSHWIFCAWLAIQAPRRLADDKRSGALELLLCTPQTTSEIVSGLMRALRRRFGRVLLAMMILDGYAAYAYFAVRRSQTWPAVLKDDLFQVVLCGAVVIPVQVYTFARVGIYQGLAQGNSLRATWHLVVKLGVLPWILFVTSLFSFEFARRMFRFQLNFNEWLIFGFWTCCHLGVFAFFLATANWHLRHRFRSLAAQPVAVSIWARIGRALGRLASRGRAAPRV